MNAHMAVDGRTGKYPEFKGNVATVYTHDMARGGSGNGHYGGNAKVYMDIGEAIGKAMIELMKPWRLGAREVLMAGNMARSGQTGRSMRSVRDRRSMKAPWRLVTKGSFTSAKDNKISFRRGMCAGPEKGEAP
jgi:hypothetical protein